MTLVNIFLHDVAQNWERGDSVIFSAPVFRGGADGSVVSTAPVRVPLEPDGTATVDLVPGPVDVQFKCRVFKDDQPKRGYVPMSGPVSLWDVILEWTPALVDQSILAIEAARDEALGQVEGAIDAEIGGTTHVISTGAGAIHAGKVVRLNENGKLHIGDGTVTGRTDPANKQYVDREVNTRAPSTHEHRGSDIVSEVTEFISHTDDRFANQLVRLNANGKLYITTAGITGPFDPVNKQYVDNAISAGSPDGGQTMWWN